MLFDTHMHCEYSCDSHQTIQEAIAEGLAKNIGVTITEHWDYDYPTNPEAFLFDREAYFTEIMPLRNERVLVGIEMGMQPHIIQENKALVAAHPYDYVLASIHCVGGRDLYEPTCYIGKTKEEAVREYLREAIFCMKEQGDFDSLAHLDYPCRYWPYEDKELRLDIAPNLFDEFFLTAIRLQKPLEINTRRLDNSESVAALQIIYQRYAQLGGSYCTLGSDAHYREHVGRRLATALAIAKKAGLQPVYFREREMQLMEV